MEEDIVDYRFSKNNEVSFLSSIPHRSNLVYRILIGCIFLLGASLPFLKVDITRKAGFTVETEVSKEEIAIASPGRIKKLYYRDNIKVQAGDTLALLDVTHLEDKRRLLVQRMALLKGFLRDLQKLDKIAPHSVTQLESEQYRTEAAVLFEQTQTAGNALQREKTRYERNLSLFNSKVISQSEFEQYEHDFRKAQSDLELIHKNSKARWQQEYTRYSQEVASLRDELLEIDNRISLGTIRANIRGTVYKAPGVQTGSYVQASQVIAEISPDSSLLVTCYVSARDIGLISLGQKVNLQFESFSYSEWGVMTTSVAEISQDVVHLNGNYPAYKVKCLLPQPYLTLQNGYKGSIMKGMNGVANFVVTRRSLWQLLTDNIDDWFNPSREIANYNGN